MKRTTEQTFSISIPESARNLREKILEGGRKADNTFNNVITNVEEVKGTKEYIEKYFPIVKASELMLGDEFLKYRPETVEQSNFKRRLIKTIKYGISDFRAQSIDPSFDEKGKICYKAEMKPAIGKSVKWWKQNSEEFLPEKESRLGTTKQRDALLGVLIKYLIEEQGYTIGEAWKAVCNQSKDIGHYWDSKNPKYNFETTGSRRIGDWCDLANTYKITIDEKGFFSLFGGYFDNRGDLYPLADTCTYAFSSYDLDYSVGWLVLSV